MKRVRHESDVLPVEDSLFGWFAYLKPDFVGERRSESSLCPDHPYDSHCQCGKTDTDCVENPDELDFVAKVKKFFGW